MSPEGYEGYQGYEKHQERPRRQVDHVHSSPFNPHLDDGHELDAASEDSFDRHGGISKLTIAMWVMISLIVVISAAWMLISYLRGELIIG